MLRPTAAEYSAIFEALPNATIMVDAQTEIITVNPAFVNLFGYDQHEVVGKHISLLHGEEGNGQAKGTAHWLSGSSNQRNSKRAILRTKDGSLFAAVMTVAEVKGEDGEPLGALRIIQPETNETAEMWVQNLLESAPMGILATDERGKLRFANQEIERIFEYDRGELIGQPLEKLLPQRFRHVHARHRSNYSNDPYFRTMGIGLNLVGQRKSGEEFPVEVSLNSTSLGPDKAIIAFAVDISERHRIERKLARYTSELEAQNAELDAFAHTVAHDLKTPVSLIMGYAEMLQRFPAKVTESTMREAVDQISSTGHRLNNIIGELILLASVRQTDVNMVPLNMFAIVEEAQKRLSFMCREFRAEITLPYTWEMALGYGPWIEEVWVNFLSNAIKYGGRPPQIELGSFRLDDDENMIRFWIRDKGLGIAPADQEKIFAPFTQLSQVRTEGHGLGLSIVQRIVEKCRGAVGVDSTPGEGSVFWFDLPVFAE